MGWRSVGGGPLDGRRKPLKCRIPTYFLRRERQTTDRDDDDEQENRGRGDTNALPGSQANQRLNARHTPGAQDFKRAERKRETFPRRHKHNGQHCHGNQDNPRDREEGK